MIRRPMVKVAACLAGVPVAAVVLVMIVLGSMDFSRYKGMVVEAVRTATGRELTIAGEVDLSFGFTPSLVVDRITLTNAPWGTRPEMLTVGRVEVKVALLPLLAGRLAVRRLVLVEPDILLETDGSGVGNWVFPQSAGSRGDLPEVNRVEIRQGVFRYRDGKSGRTTLLALERLEAGAAGLDSPIAMELHGAWNEAPVEARASLGSLRSATAGEPFPLSLVATAGGAAIKIDGTVSGAAGDTAGKGLDLALGLEGADLAGLAGLAGVSLHRMGPYRLQGRLTGKADGYLLDGIRAGLGRSDLAGSLAVRTAGKRPGLEAHLTSDLLDLRDFLRPEPGKKAAAPAGKDGFKGRKIFTDKPLDLAALQGVDARVQFRAGRLQTPSLLLENVKAALVLAGGRLSVQPFTAGLGGGNLTAGLVLNSGRTMPQLRFNLKASGVAAGAVLAQLGKGEIMSGVPLDIDLELSGNGNSQRAVMAGLNGRFLLQAGQGRVNNRYLDFAGGDVLSQLLAALHPTAVRKDYTVLECAVVNFTVKDGIATTNRGIAAKTTLMTVVGSGGINLKTEGLDIGIKPAARSGIGVNLGQLAGAVRLGGTLAEPGVRVDPLGVAKTAATIGGAIATGGVSLLAGALFERATTDDDPCRTALGSKAGSKGAAAPADDGREDGIGGMLRGLFGR